MKKTVCITGVTGAMGMATLKEFLPRLERFNLRLLARDSAKNRKLLKPYANLRGITVIWGDLTEAQDVKEAVGESDFVLHIGGMVSPMADRYPDKTLKVNVAAAKNVANAVLEGPKAESCGVVYIGSVAQLGDRRPPYHWGRTGDPLAVSVDDAYGVSKVEAELAIVDSGLKKWVSIRQTGILCDAIIAKGSDPITFHVPLRGMLEWTTAEDSGRLMANICEDSTPECFWNNFYNLGSGESYRLSNYEFEKLFLKALHCPAPHKVFDADWFALKNFHGQWYQDSDRLEELVPFRSEETCDQYFRRLAKSLPWFYSLAALVPAALIKAGMKWVASRPERGTLYWRKKGLTDKIETSYGSLEEMSAIQPFKDQLKELESYPGEPRGRRLPPSAPALSHGYDEEKPREDWGIEDMRQKAKFQEGELISETMTKGDLATKLKWRCSEGHEFEASPAAVLLGGHWCPECLRKRVLGK